MKVKSLIVLALLAVIGCGGAGGGGGDSPSFVGCYVLGSLGDMGNAVSTLGDPNADAAMYAEVQYQEAFWNIPTGVSVFQESQGMNSFSRPDGNIYMGVNHFWTTLNNAGSYAVMGVLAHEWGHQVQFRIVGSHRASVVNELEADGFAGLYLGLAKAFDWSLINGFLYNAYSSGDYNYTNPNWHGTPDQRLAMSKKGYEIGYWELTTGNRLSYLELHQVYYSYLGVPTSIVAPSRSTADPKELTLRPNLVAQVETWLKSPEASKALEDGSFRRARRAATAKALSDLRIAN